MDRFLSYRKPKTKDPEYPECYKDTIDDRPAYFCERIVDGQKQKFGIKFDSTNSFVCGEFEDNQLEGYGAQMSLKETQEPRLDCGQYVKGISEGSTTFNFFVGKSIQMGNVIVCLKYLNESEKIRFHDPF